MKKLLSILLSLLMVFSTIPFVMVSADGEAVVYQTIVDMSDYDGATIAQYESPWFVEGLTRSYNIGKTSYSYDAELDALKVTRGKWDAAGLYYFDKETLPLAFSDSLGFRVWLKGDVDSGADVTSTSNFVFAVDTVDETGAHVTYGAYWYDGPSYKKVIPAEGGWIELYWKDFIKNWRVVGKEGMKSNRPQFSGAGALVDYKTFMDKVDGLAVGFKTAGNDNADGAIYYIGDMQLIKPVVNVTFDNNTISGYAGQVVEVPEPTTEGVIAYSDGKKLYYAGDNYTITGETTLTNITTIVDSESAHDFVFDTEEKTYTGSEICPAVTSATLTEGEDFTVDYENNVNAGTATIYVRGTGTCFIDLSADFTISKKKLEVSDFSIAADGLTYSGEALTPEITSDVFADDDFTVVYHNNVNASENAYAIVEGAGKNGYGAVEVPFTILPKEIEEDMFGFDLENKIYNKGIEICPEVTSETLAIGEDYSVGYSTNRDVGTASLYVKGIGNYCGRIDKTFEIVPKEITDAEFTVDTDDKVYTGKEICPEVTSTLGENDYEVTYENNVDEGVATITVTGTGNYAGTLTYEFVILQKEALPEDFIIDLDDKFYTGQAIEPSVTSDVLQDKDYVVSYENNVNAGTATITVIGLGNLKGEFTKEFTINKKTLTAFDFTIDLTDKEYENKEICPEVVSTFTEDVDYTVSYENNLNVGSAKITISACGDNCQGEFALEFIIVQHELTPEDFTVEDGQFIYSGEEYKPTVASYLANDDYTVEYENNINAGTAYVTITGKENCKGEATIAFTIEQKEIEEEWFSLEETSVIFNGIEQQVAVVSELEEDVDYEVSYEDNLDVGTATVTVTGIGNYTGEVTKTFEITQKEVEKDYFTVDTSDKVYTGDEVTPVVASELEKDVDYTVEYSNNVNVGVATVTIKGIGNYKDEVVETFNITPKSLDAGDFVIDTKNVIYTGSEIKPQVMTTLSLDCYEVTYENNVNVGDGKVIVTGKGNYKDTVTATFKIVAKSISESNFTFDLTKERIYSGEAFEDAVTSELAKDVDYTVAYENNVNAGVATVTVTGIGNYAGTIVKTFAISQKAIDETMFEVDTKAKEYTGKAIMPSIATALVLGTDYTVEYSNNKNVGKATITVTGIGNYTGELNYKFTIKKPTVKKVKGVKVTSTKAKTLTVKWKKVKGVKGYVIHVSLKKNFKGKKVIVVKKQKTVKKLIKKLKSGKKYYVRVAAYKNYKNSKGKTVKAIGKFTKVKRAITVK